MFLLVLACLKPKPILQESGTEEETVIDDDEDGFPAEDDCDDLDAAVNPDAEEVCNGIDDNCDEVVDTDATDQGTWYVDGDSDGHGDPDLELQACDQPSGYVAANDDCDDTEPTVHAGATELCDHLDNDCDGETDEDGLTWWFLDADSDGYGDIEDPGEETCGMPEGKVADNTDCDDERFETNPGAFEYCNDIDDDCDGVIDPDSSVDATTWYVDADSDGYGSTAFPSATQCEQPDGYVTDNTDCDDLDEQVFPGADEYCNTYDDDCDGITDEDSAVDATTWYEDADVDGYGNASSRDVQCTQPTGYVSNSMDCDDTNAAVSPDAPELCSTSDDDDCDGDVNEDDAADTTTWYDDDDSDGYGDSGDSQTACDRPSGHVTTSGDCDDTDSDTNPGADEYCDGHDDDCDGDVDEDDAVDATTWYGDDDSDGFGEDADSTTACDQPSGYEPKGGDCDDSDDDIYPGADEYCNTEDDDCDGDVDEDDALDVSTFYADTDGDGYGDASSTNDQCYADSSYVSDDTDCDDSDYDVNPGATEVCGNGIDDDCDEEIGSDCGPYGTVSLNDAEAKITGESSYDYLGRSVAGGDLDGDGYADLVATSMYLAYYGAENYVFLGPISGEIDAGDADIIIEGDSGVGQDAVIVGDLDGDGVDDLVLSGPNYPYLGATSNAQRGGIFFFFGPTTGEWDQDDADAVVLGDESYDGFGYRVAEAGDADGDGYDDLWTSSITYKNDYGSAILLQGPFSGSSSGASIYVYDSSNYTYAGTDLDGSGDTNGDGANDLVVGAPSSDEAWVVLGPVTTSTEVGDVDAVLTGSSGGYAGTSSVFLPDANGDGYDEVVIGAPYEDSYRGNVYIVNGPVSADATLSSDADATLNGPSSGYGGYTLAACDIDGDGNGDVVAGAPATGSYKGKIYLFLGPVTGTMNMAANADGILTGEAAGDYASYYEGLACGGDHDADGYEDIVVGAPYEDTGGTNAGAAYVVLGGGGL